MSAFFEIRLTKNAEKDLSGLRDLSHKAIKEILTLKQDPYSGHMLKGSLQGVRSLEFSLQSVASCSLFGIARRKGLFGIHGWNS